jgi:nicotinamide mononucleotide transporter
MDYLHIKSIFFTALGYNMSYLEFFGAVTGGIAVWLSAKGKIWSWPLGLINVTLFFFLFYQVQLYPDMFLQVFFFVTNLLGWWRWSHPASMEADGNKQLKVSFMQRGQLFIFLAIGVAGTLLFGSLASRLHTFFPTMFSLPSAFPFADSFVTVMSIVATYLMVQKKAECWLVWIAVDVVATYLYFSKSILFVGVEYLIFCLIAAFGFFSWLSEFKNYPKAITE